MPVTLGVAPEQMTLVLTSGSDFVCTIVSDAGDWPTAAVIAIEVGDTTWTATVVGDEARFDVDKAEVNALLAQKPKRFRLTYTEGDADLVWGTGSVISVVY